MFIIDYIRGDKRDSFVTNDYRTACIIAYNQVHKLGCVHAYVIDAETYEILKIYES